MNIEQEIRVQIEKNRDLKLAVGEINNHLSVLEGLLRNERDDAQKWVDDAYQRGLDDAWECARELYLNGACKDLFGEYFNTFIKYHTAQEAIEKLKAHKQDDKIEVGDEVKHDQGWVAVVTQIDGSGLSCVDKSGAVASYSDTSKFRKTGRHFDIEKILEEMKE